MNRRIFIKTSALASGTIALLSFTCRINTETKKLEGVWLHDSLAIGGHDPAVGSLVLFKNGNVGYIVKRGHGRCFAISVNSQEPLDTDQGDPYVVFENATR